MRRPDRSAAERVYRALLVLYPPSFRGEYQRDLVQGFRDREREPRHQGFRGRIALWALVASDLLTSAPREWHRSVRRGAGRSTAGRRHGGRGKAIRRGVGRRNQHARWEEGMGIGIGAPIGSALQDLRFAARSLARRAGYTAAAVTTLAVGIAGAATMFGVVDGIVLRPLPYPDSERLVQIGIRHEGWDGLSSVTPAELHRWTDGLSTVRVAGSRLQALTVRGDGDPEILRGAGVSGSFFDLLGVQAARGRLFDTSEDDAAAPPVAVLTWGAWQRRWGGDPSVLGRSVELDGAPFTVVGVLPRGYVAPEALYHRDMEVYFPLQHVSDDVSPSVMENAFLQVVGRLAPGVGLDAARGELGAVEAELLSEHGYPPDARALGLERLHDRTVGGFGRTLLPFLGAVGLLLLVACANVANLSLVRATERGREIAVRTVLGAGRGRLVRQLLTESLLLAAAAGAAGVACAYGAVEAFRRFAPDGIPRAQEVALDPRVLLFAVGLATATGLLFGLAPILHALRSQTRLGLADRGTGAPTGGSRLRSVLVAAEVAMALVLFVGAGLLARSFVGLVGTDLGFDPEGVAYMTVAPEGERWASPEARIELYRALYDRLASHPAVAAVGGTSNLPLSGNESVRNVTIDGFESPDEMGVDVSYNRVLPGFFQATGVSLLEGRAFRWSDGGASVPAVVNRAMASRFWPGDDALGGRLRFGSGDMDTPWMTVVGVVDDIRQLAPDQAPVPQLYVPFTAFPTGLQTLVARPSDDGGSLVESLRRALRDVAPGLPVHRAGSLDGLLEASVVRPRFFALVLGAFATISLLLAVVGVYGVTAYSVRQRTRELGVRMALGADPGRVRRTVLRRGLALTATGLVVGLALSLLATRALEGLVYGVTPTDPATLVGAVLTLAAAAALASWFPAARATRIDPTEALRVE